MKISDNLRRLMDDVKITEAQLARKTGTPQPTLHRILSGATRSPRGDSLSKLANFFSVTISQLIGDDPLPTDRLPGTHNPYVRSWSSIPMIPLEEAHNRQVVQDKLAVENWPHWTTTDVQITDTTFAIKVENDNLNPRFPIGTVLIIEPNLEAEDRDFIVVKTRGIQTVTIKQLLLDGQHKYLKPLNPEFQTTMMSEEHEIVGVILQARTDIRRRTQAAATA